MVLKIFGLKILLFINYYFLFQNMLKNLILNNNLYNLATGFILPKNSYLRDGW